MFLLFIYLQFRTGTDLKWAISMWTWWHIVKSQHFRKKARRLLQVQGHLGLHIETLSQKKNKKKIHVVVWIRITSPIGLYFLFFIPSWWNYLEGLRRVALLEEMWHRGDSEASRGSCHPQYPLCLLLPVQDVSFQLPQGFPNLDSWEIQLVNFS